MKQNLIKYILRTAILTAGLATGANAYNPENNYLAIDLKCDFNNNEILNSNEKQGIFINNTPTRINSYFNDINFSSLFTENKKISQFIFY